MPLDLKTLAFVKEKFAEHYRSGAIVMPERFPSREFGFFHFDSPSMQRPVAFRTKQDAVRFLSERTPAHVYYSAAYYEDPRVPMAEKRWLGADLIFDLDADHLRDVKKKNMTY